jgi:hypothetical protein
LSAAHPFDPAQVIPRYPDILFFSEGSPGGGAANRIALVYDREQANYRAGMAIAALFDNPEFLERIGAGVEEGSDPKVGILAAVTSDSVRRESAAFIEGFSQLRDPAHIEMREIGNLTDRVKARRLLEGMREESVGIVFLKTYVLSGFCLDYLAKESGTAIVEGAVPDQAYGGVVLLMLVDDFGGALARMAEAVGAEEQGGMTEEVSAPVELRWGGSYRPLVEGALQEANQRGATRQ